jgi:hypothetical protein
MKNRILIASAGTAAAWQIVTTISEKFRDFFEVLVCDINPSYLIPASTLAAKFIQVPRIVDDGYYDFMINVMLEERVNIFVPIIDHDLFLFPRDSEFFAKSGIFSSAPVTSAVEIVRSKRKLGEYLKNKGIPVPDNPSKEEIKEKRKYFLKPDKEYGGSKGARVISGKEARRLIADENYLIQEVCEMPEVTAEVFSRHGDLFTLSRERIESKAGVCTKARIFRDLGLEEIVNNIGQVISLPEASCMQFMKRKETREWVTTDINLRLGAGTGISSKVGWDLTCAAISEWAGGLVSNPLIYLNSMDEEHIVVRVFKEIIMR